MVKKKRKSKTAAVDDDEFEGGGGKKSRGLTALSEEEKMRLVFEVARFLLFAEGDKTSITRTDINKAVLSELKMGHLLTPLLPLAEKELNRIFGWDVVVVPSFTPKGKFEELSKTTLQCRLSPELEAFMAPIHQDMPVLPNQIFVMIVCSIIMMQNFSIDEELLYTRLTKFGFQKDVKIQIFGNKSPFELVKDLAKAHYIAIYKDKESGSPVPLINIGSRSLLEIGKLNILKFVNSICKTSMDPSTLREFTNEQEQYLSQPAAGETAGEARNRPATQSSANGAPPANGVELPNGNGVANGNGHANGNGASMDLEEEEPVPRRGRRAKAAAATQEMDAEPQASQGRRRSRRGEV